jgi:hypothetical protein
VDRFAAEQGRPGHPLRAQGDRRALEEAKEEALTARATKACPSTCAAPFEDAVRVLRLSWSPVDGYAHSMIVNQQGWAAYVPGSASWGPITELERPAQAVIDDVLTPLRIPALKELRIFWMTPAPKRGLKAPAVLDVRYVAAKRTAHARVMQSPAVFGEDPRWSAYRVAYVRECARLIDEVLARIEDKLHASDLRGDLGPARAAIARDLAKLTRSHERAAGKKTTPSKEKPPRSKKKLRDC